MSTKNPFIAATKSKLRFPTTSGHLATEDLWDLTLKRLDQIGGSLIAALGDGRSSLLANPDHRVTRAEEENRLRLDVIKAVIREKEQDNAAKLSASKTRAQLDFLTGLKEKKKMAELENLSVEEIESQIAALSGEGAPEPETAEAS